MNRSALTLWQQPLSFVLMAQKRSPVDIEASPQRVCLEMTRLKPSSWIPSTRASRDDHYFMDSAIPTTPLSFGFEDPYRVVTRRAGERPSIWAAYNRIVDAQDAKLFGQWNSDMDILLIYAALISAVVTAFILTSINNLTPDYDQISSLILFQIMMNEPIPGANPNIPFSPRIGAIVVNFLWFTSLFLSLGASVGAMLCKEWFKQYLSGPEFLSHLERACRRQTRFMTFQRWHVGTMVALLPFLLHISVLLFATGVLAYLWPIYRPLALLLAIIIGIMTTSYLCLVVLPLFTPAPFRTFATQIIEQILTGLTRSFYFALNGAFWVCSAAPRVLVNCVTLPLCQKLTNITGVKRSTSTILWLQNFMWANASFKPFHFNWNPNSIPVDISEDIKEAVLVHLIQTPLNDAETEEVVTSLEWITRSSSLRRIARRPLILYLSILLQSSFYRNTIVPSRLQIAFYCVLILARIKFRLTVELNQDADDDIGGIAISPLVARAAQVLLMQTQIGTDSYFRLLAATTWLSPVEARVSTNESKYTIRNRQAFLTMITNHIDEHVTGVLKLDDGIIIQLINSIHSCIPRRSCSIAPSTPISVHPLLSDIFNSSQSESEDVFHALAFYALDLVSTNSREWARRDEKHDLAFLVTQLLEHLENSPRQFLDVLHFTCSLIYKHPKVKLSNQMPHPLLDITRLCVKYGHSPTQAIRSDVFDSTLKAYAASLKFVLQSVDPGGVSRLIVTDVLQSIKFIKQGLNGSSIRLNPVHAISMAMHLLPSHTSNILRDIEPSCLTGALLSTYNTGTCVADIEHCRDTEQGEWQLENTIDLKIHILLVLKHSRWPFTVNVDSWKHLIQSSKNVAVTHSNPRLRWKTTYLLSLFADYLSEEELAWQIQMLNEDFRKRFEAGETYLVKDWENCAFLLIPRGLNCLVELAPKDKYLGEPAFDWVGDFPAISSSRFGVI